MANIQGVVVKSPQQSALLGARNITPPPSITLADITNANMIENRRREALDYVSNLKKRVMDDHSSVATLDLEEAASYQIGTEVIRVIANFPAVTDITLLQQQVLDSEQRLQNQLQQMQQQLQNQMQQMQQQH